MLEILEGMRRFLESGGPVLWSIGIVGVLLASLIIERYWYCRWDFSRHMKLQVSKWQGRSEHKGWAA